MKISVVNNFVVVCPLDALSSCDNFVVVSPSLCGNTDTVFTVEPACSLRAATVAADHELILVYGSLSLPIPWEVSWCVSAPIPHLTSCFPLSNCTIPSKSRRLHHGRRWSFAPVARLEPGVGRRASPCCVESGGVVALKKSSYIPRFPCGSLFCHRASCRQRHSDRLFGRGSVPLESWDMSL